MGCANCGADRDPAQEFCASCGIPAPSATSTAVASPAPVQMPTPPADGQWPDGQQPAPAAMYPTASYPGARSPDLRPRRPTALAVLAGLIFLTGVIRSIDTSLRSAYYSSSLRTEVLTYLAPAWVSRHTVEILIRTNIWYVVQTIISGVALLNALAVCLLALARARRAAGVAGLVLGAELIVIGVLMLVEAIDEHAIDYLTTDMLIRYVVGPAAVAVIAGIAALIVSVLAIRTAKSAPAFEPTFAGPQA